MHLSTASYGSKFSQILEKRDNKNVIDFFIESYSFNASLVIWFNQQIPALLLTWYFKIATQQILSSLTCLCQIFQPSQFAFGSEVGSNSWFFCLTPRIPSPTPSWCFCLQLGYFDFWYSMNKCKRVKERKRDRERAKEKKQTKIANFVCPNHVMMDIYLVSNNLITHYKSNLPSQSRVKSNFHAYFFAQIPTAFLGHSFYGRQKW